MKHKPCSFHVRLGIPMYCSTDCLRWRQEVDERIAAEIAGLELKSKSEEG